MNILILTAKCGMGHYTVSISLKQELENENNHVEIIDFFDIIFPKMKKIIYGVFNFLVKKCRKIYNFFYKFSARTNSVPSDRITQKRIEKMLKEKNIDIVISTFPVCSKYISIYKKTNKTNLKLYTYITDIDINKEWLTDETDSYFVASYETKEQILKYNIPENKIKVVGIPVRKGFKEKTNEKQKNEVIITGGGLGLIPQVKKNLEELSKNKDIHVTVLAGKNQKLFQKYYEKYRNVEVIGYTDDVDKYIKRAQLIVTKAGGITLFEAINSKTPIYVVYPFLSQEIGNAKFIQENQIGLVNWNRKENITQDILELLKSPYKLEVMRENMQRINDNLEKLTVIDVYREEKIKKC